MGRVNTFKDLIAWQKAIGLAKSVYQATSGFPRAEKFGLTAQVRRAVVSISSNIAEGHGRRSTADYLRFLRIAKGSASEVESLWILANELDFLDKSEFEQVYELILEQIRVLDGLIRGLQLCVDRIEQSGPGGSGVYPQG